MLPSLLGGNSRPRTIKYVSVGLGTLRLWGAVFTTAPQRIGPMLNDGWSIDVRVHTQSGFFSRNPALFNKTARDNFSVISAINCKATS